MWSALIHGANEGQYTAELEKRATPYCALSREEKEEFHPTYWPSRNKKRASDNKMLISAKSGMIEKRNGGIG